MAFQWKERYKLGLDEIDKQHQKLFEIGASVYDLALLDDSYDHYDEIMELLGELLDYTEYHFRYEEDLMKKFKYEEVGEQEKDHGFYTNKIRGISPETVDLDQNRTILELVDFLSEWISNHILISDRKYALYFKERGITV